MKLINPLVIIRILSTILIIEAVCFLFCVPVALIYREPLSPFTYSALLTGIISILLTVISLKADTSKISNRDGYLAVTLSWIIFCIAGSLPYLFSSQISDFTDALFESTSGFTTTGASVINNVEGLPFSILFWRSLTHWIGGIGIILLVILILPSLKISAQQLFSLESSLTEKIHPQTKAIGTRILIIYLGLTIAEILLLSVGDMNLFDSICHTFGTIATGGFSTRNSGISGYSDYSQYIIALFMLLSGVSFIVYYYILKRQFNKIRNNNELWFYIGITFCAGLLVSAILILKNGHSSESAFREGFFQVISIITTTGYANSDYLFWPKAATLIIFLLLFAGACTGSSAGSIKMARHLIVIKNIRYLYRKLIHPNAIMQIKMNGKPLPEKTNKSILSFVVLYLFIFLIGSILIVSTGIDPVTSASASATALGNVGPGLGPIGPLFTYAGLPVATKIIITVLMIVGRLEIITVFALFTRSFWRL